MSGRTRPEEHDDREAALRFFGLGHTRAADLPTPAVRAVLHAWEGAGDLSPSERGWLSLGRARVAARARDFEAAHALLAEVDGTLEDPSARVERALLFACVEEGLGSLPSRLRALDEARELVAALPVGHGDRVDFEARLADHAAHDHLRAGEIERAREVYASIVDTTPYAACRRALGLSYAAGSAGDREGARRHALAASRHAGDGGYVRLRAVALGLLAELRGAGRESMVRRRAVALARETLDR